MNIAEDIQKYLLLVYGDFIIFSNIRISTSIFVHIFWYKASYNIGRFFSQVSLYINMCVPFLNIYLVLMFVQNSTYCCMTHRCRFDWWFHYVFIFCWEKAFIDDSLVPSSVIALHNASGVTFRTSQEPRARLALMRSNSK